MGQSKNETDPFVTSAKRTETAGRRKCHGWCQAWRCFHVTELEAGALSTAHLCLFVLGNASEVLKEWTVTGKKKVMPLNILY